MPSSGFTSSLGLGDRCGHVVASASFSGAPCTDGDAPRDGVFEKYLWVHFQTAFFPSSLGSEGGFESGKAGGCGRG